ncbi:phosphotransferase [Alkalicoccobacillus murimartini]|uniref:tRNA A-37 threonylcarbamoyl transferase component Bud32 n=1 Tax=Alkalicoccobacillus murimartini TaxID=171685 RepID=A0ABT9YN98_9BACI|nr:phosphotransferase [Alkalicoccobacillus murimartini]MDQ0208677.1 tRNA A-37 threonylcarbamoyl transferase component Bud32 [Alkalicoccobacillus murimartini]
MTSHDGKEEWLDGGNMSNVYRSGETVRRDLKTDSKRVHLLLKHLERKGFDYAPKFIGIDENNREIVTFIEGEAGNYPLKEYMWSNESLKEIAKMLRHYHDSVSDFPLLNEWKPMEGTPGEKEVVCHNDFAMYNIIFNKQHPVGIIDFDVAAPGPRLWDIAYTLYTCVPLSRLSYTEKGEIVYYEQSSDSTIRKERITLFFEAYGMKDLDKDFLEMVLLRIECLCTYMIKKASEGDAAFQKMIDEGHLIHYKKDLEFIREHGHEWI